MKRMLLGLTVGLLVTGTSLVFAQTTPAPPPAPEAPAAKSTEPSAAKTTGTLWYSGQVDETRASKLIGAKVVNPANETVGDVNEILLTKDGKVAAVILGVGGFLGMGEREVAINFDTMRMGRDQNNNLVLSVNATKDSLKAAPAWHWDNSTKK